MIFRKKLYIKIKYATTQPNSTHTKSPTDVSTQYFVLKNVKVIMKIWVINEVSHPSYKYFISQPQYIFINFCNCYLYYTHIWRIVCVIFFWIDMARNVGVRALWGLSWSKASLFIFILDYISDSLSRNSWIFNVCDYIGMVFIFAKDVLCNLIIIIMRTDLLVK